MNYSGILKKYILLLRLLEPPAAYPSIPRVRDYLSENGFVNVGKRTIQRDFKALREELGIPVGYCNRKRGYYLKQETDEDLTDAIYAIRLLELADNVSDILSSLKETKETKQFIFFDHAQNFRGRNHLGFLIKAIKGKRIIEFIYTSYQHGQQRERKAVPVLLFEFRNRWYLLAREVHNDKIKTFGLDRMTKLRLTAELFQQEHINFREYFKHTFGVTYTEESPEQVVLSFHPGQAHYLKALPLHQSQRVLQDDEEAFVISLRLIINYELKQEILSHGSRVQVLEPESLRKEIQQEHQKALALYTTEKIC